MGKCTPGGICTPGWEPLLYVISCIRQPVAQELDKIHVVYARKYCTSRPTSGLGELDQNLHSAAVERVLEYIRSV